VSGLQRDVGLFLFLRLRNFNLVVHDVNRFGEIARLVEGLSKKVLTTQLREMETDGILQRKVYDQRQKKVEYSLTEKGKTFIPVIEAMCTWGLNTGGNIEMP